MSGPVKVEFLTMSGSACPPDQNPQRFTFRCIRKPEENCANLLIADAGHGIPRDGKNEHGGRAQWAWNGNRDTPSFTPSIDCRCDGGCGWHGYIEGGNWRDA